MISPPGCRRQFLRTPLRAFEDRLETAVPNLYGGSRRFRQFAGTFAPADDSNLRHYLRENRRSRDRQDFHPAGCQAPSLLASLT